MSRPDTVATAALQEQFIRPVFLAYLDFADEPVRVNTSGQDVTITGTSDPDMDGHVFLGISPDVADISAIKVGEGGSDSVKATLSGIPGFDDDVLDQLEDRANWQGREARIWRIIRNEFGAQQGGVQHIYTGYMTALDKEAGESCTIDITIESYLAALSEASNRTYLDQEYFDPGDQSARAAIAIANGDTGTGNAASVTGGLRGGGGNGFGRLANVVNV